jgi:hypothetical protein
MNSALAPPPCIVAPTPHNTLAKVLPPRVSYNTRAVVHPNYTTDQAILTQLYLDTMDERELQIISTTIEFNAAAQAWSLQHGVILHNECYYIPVTSPFL